MVNGQEWEQAPGGQGKVTTVFEVRSSTDGFVPAKGLADLPCGITNANKTQNDSTALIDVTRVIIFGIAMSVDPPAGSDANSHVQLPVHPREIKIVPGFDDLAVSNSRDCHPCKIDG